MNENSFQSHAQIEDWAGLSASYLRQLSHNVAGVTGRKINAIAEKLEAAVIEAYEQGREDEAADWRYETR